MAEGRCGNRIHLRVRGGKKGGNRGQEKEEREKRRSLLRVQFKQDAAQNGSSARLTVTAHWSPGPQA